MTDLKKPTNSEPLLQASVSFGVAVIPTVPLKDQLASASLAITKQFDNDNIIDNKTFPAHLSLYLGGTDYEFIDSLCTNLQAATTGFLVTQLVAEKLYSGHRGFIAVKCAKSTALIALVRCIIDVCSVLHRQQPRYRPHLINRWIRLSNEQQRLLKQYGTYKTPEYFDPHLSVAQVSEYDVTEVVPIVKQYLPLPQEFGIEAIQIVDVGHNNEQWRVLHQWSGIT